MPCWTIRKHFQPLLEKGKLTLGETVQERLYTVAILEASRTTFRLNFDVRDQSFWIVLTTNEADRDSKRQGEGVSVNLDFVLSSLDTSFVPGKIRVRDVGLDEAIRSYACLIERHFCNLDPVDVDVMRDAARRAEEHLRLTVKGSEESI